MGPLARDRLHGGHDTNPLLAMVVDEMERHLTDTGYTLLLANAHHDREQEREIVAMFEDREGMDGAIISSSFLYPVRAHNPLRRPPGCRW